MIASGRPVGRCACRRPLLTTRRTFVPCLCHVPAPGFCPTTRPAVIVGENAFVILPSAQRALWSALLAAASPLPFSFGTAQTVKEVETCPLVPKLGSGYPSGR